MESCLNLSQEAGDEEYVLLDLDDVDGLTNDDMAANTSYVLSGLDTLNPTLVIGNQLKLIGEYHETIGTCYVFLETDKVPARRSEGSPSRETSNVDLQAASMKKGQPLVSLHKVLKFRKALLTEGHSCEASK